MKIFKGKILYDGTIIDIAKKESEQIDIVHNINDKTLQNAFKHYKRLLQIDEYLNSQQKIYAKDTDTLFLSISWMDVVQSLEFAKKSLDNYKIVLKEIQKSFSYLKKNSLNYKNEKQLFVYILKTYELELNRYNGLIKKAEEIKKNLVFNSQKTR